MKDSICPFDIQNLKVDTNTAKDNRISSYIDDVKDPYHILVNGTCVKVRYSSDQSLEEKLVRLIRRESKTDRTT